MVWKVSVHLSSMVFLMLGSLVCGLGFFSTWSGESCLIECEVSFINPCSMIMSLLLDPVSLIFCSFVLLISSMVLYYSGDM